MSASGDLVVEIPQGKLRGKEVKSEFGPEYFSFHRIPYAKPPVRELRFKAPEPADGWTGIRDATYEGPTCPRTEWNDKTQYLNNVDEDCLFVNVFCKHNPTQLQGKKYPVLVTIHGGGFEYGSGNVDQCGPDYFMFHDVIYITLNYRLGALGFLSLQSVECPGNFGLKDQQLALRWIKNNVAYFGGDPDNITIFGISAGAASVHYQTLVPSNAGLFKRAIAQSGTAVSKWAFAKKPRDNAFQLGKRLGCYTEDDTVLLEFLKKASAKDITVNSLGIILETEGVALGEQNIPLTFVPTAEPDHEGAFITKHPLVLMKMGQELDVPLIVGMCQKEMIFGVEGPDGYPSLQKVEEFQDFIPKDFPIRKNSEEALTVAKRFKDFYFPNGINLDNYIDLLSDAYFNYPVYRVIKSRESNKNIKSPTYLYLFSYDGGQSFVKQMRKMENYKGTSHGDDCAYLYTTIFCKKETMSPGHADYKVMRNFTKLWVNFATGGEPTLEEENVTWKKTSIDELEYLDLGENFVMKRGLIKDRFKFWDEIYSSYYD